MVDLMSAEVGRKARFSDSQTGPDLLCRGRVSGVKVSKGQACSWHLGFCRLESGEMIDNGAVCQRTGIVMSDREYLGLGCG